MTKRVVFLVAVSLWMATGSPARAAGETGRQVKLAAISQAAQNAIKAVVGTGKIEQITRTADVGYNSLEVDYLKNGVSRSFTVSSLGKLLDRQVYIGEVPAPTQKTIREQAAGGRIIDITWIDDEGDIFYFAEMEKGGRKHAVSIDPEGKLLSVQVELTELPPAVQKLIKEKVSDGKLVDIDKSDEKGDVTFDVNYLKGTVKKSFTVDDDGDLISEQVTLGDTPAAVQMTIKEQTGKDRFKRVDKVVEEEVPYYHVEVIRSEKKTSFKVGMDGKFLGPGE